MLNGQQLPWGTVGSVNLLLSFAALLFKQIEAKVRVVGCSTLWRICSFAEVSKEELFSRKCCLASFPGRAVAGSLYLLCTGSIIKQVKIISSCFEQFQNDSQKLQLLRKTAVPSKSQTQHEAVGQGVSVLTVTARAREPTNPCGTQPQLLLLLLLSVCREVPAPWTHDMSVDDSLCSQKV